MQSMWIASNTIFRAVSCIQHCGLCVSRNRATRYAWNAQTGSVGILDKNLKHVFLESHLCASNTGQVALSNKNHNTDSYEI
jgi:hypothetical protein